jgi:putative ABC transport system permease protein
MPFLVVLQITVACAIASNTLFLLQQKMSPILTPTGITNPDHVVALWGFTGRGHPWSAVRLGELEVVLRAVPGVRAVSYAASFPFVQGLRIDANVMGAGAPTGAKASAYVYVGDHLVRTLGLRLVAGRDFTPQESATTVGSSMGFGRSGPVIITRALADKLFHNGHALGRRVRYVGSRKNQRTVVGIVANLMQNYYGQDSKNINYSMLLPGVANRWPRPIFAARVSASNMGAACKSLRTVIKNDLGAQMLRSGTVHCDTLAFLHDSMLARPRAAVWLLSGVTLIVLTVTLTGVMGLTSYWVQQRVKQIGIRRALGATRGDISHYVRTENLTLVTVGAILGLIAGYGVNLWLMRHYELLRLPWEYLPASAVFFVITGQFAVLRPALRASHVPPAVATRNV